MKLERVLYTAHATSTGGREGSSRSDDGVLDLKLTTPKSLGGNGAVGTNPEQLFAAGYSARSAALQALPRRLSLGCALRLAGALSLRNAGTSCSRTSS